MTNKEWRNPYRLTIWDELEKLKRDVQQLKSKSETYDEFWEIKTLGELDNLIASIRTELQKYGRVSVSVERHDL